jgi:DNA (cytosine-5)-methyltransferase 1
MITVTGADLFCGAGGFTTGLVNATRELGLDIQLLAVNHWDVAIATHSANHPGVRHLCESLDGVDPRKVVPSGKLHILMASPECTHHSNARGGKPMSDQSRATAWHILRWAEALYIENILIENVREFREWGPLGANGRPLESKKGRLFRQFISSLRALGYTVDDRVMNAADYGDATTRQRLFIQARRGRRKISWPCPSHLPPGSLDLGGEGQQWRPAREIIDWNIPGQSIYGRTRPLSPNTMRRILAGLQKFSGLQPYIIGMEHYGAGNGERVYDLGKPLPTVTAKGQFGLCEPFLVVLRNNCDARSIDAPLPSLCASGEHVGLCEPFILPHQHGSSGDHNVRSIEAPLPTITGTSSDIFLAQPFLVNMKGKSTACSIDRPMPTQTAHSPHLYLAEPYLVKYNGTGGAMSVEEPLDTVTGKDRFGLACPEIINDGEVAMVDIRFRMLQPHELAAAMSFPDGYQFAGARDAKVKQIGNAVPVRLATALCKSILQGGVS